MWLTSLHNTKDTCNVYREQAKCKNQPSETREGIKVEENVQGENSKDVVGGTSLCDTLCVMRFCWCEHTSNPERVRAEQQGKLVHRAGWVVGENAPLKGLKGPDIFYF